MDGNCTIWRTPTRSAPRWYTGTGSPNARPNPQYAAFNTRGNRGRSQYHGVTFGVDARQLGNTGLRLPTKYTLGHTQDNLSSTFSDGGAGNFGLGYLDAFDPMLDWGDAEFDVRHRLSLAGVWELPFGNDSGALMRTLIGGWQLNWIAYREIGLCLLDLRLPPGTRQLSLAKRFRFGSTRALQLRFEAYNALNHANMFIQPGFPSQDITTGFVKGLKAGNRRTQVALKFEF